MNNKIVYPVLSLSIVFLIIYTFIPSSRQYFSYFVVLGFAILTIYLTWDGIKIRQKLQNQLNQPKSSSSQKNKLSQIQQDIVDEVKRVYTKHGKDKYEQINKTALMDRIINNNLKEWEKNKRYYQSLPNFLLSIGLLGTFLGITLNLLLISGNLGGEVDIQTILPDIVNSMGIAFGSSLFALACSILLVKFYPVSELEIEKENLIIILDDYVDNEYLLNTQNTTKIDKLITSINQYSSTLINFLHGLDENTKRFETAIMKATSKINTSANNFQTIVNQSSQTMQTGANVLSSATNSMANLTTKFADISSSLLRSSASLDNLNQNLTNNSQKIADKLENMTNVLIGNSDNVNQLIQTNQQNLANVTDCLLENVNSISTSTQTFNNNVTQISTSLNQYSLQVGEYNNNIQQLAALINSATLSSNNNIPQLASMLGNQVNQLQTTANQLNQNSQILQQINTNLSVLLTNFQQFQQSQN